MDRLEIFQAIVDRAILTPEDEKSLLVNRGITAEVAQQLQFKSVTKELMQDPLVVGLPEEYTKILWAAHYNKAILIPFLDPTGKVDHLRPHKLNFPETGSKIYIPYELLTSTDRLVLAESEFKAVASCMMGVPAIGVPGISSFSKTKLPVLLDILMRLKCKEVVVCFDNEVKDDPALPKYKQDFRNRYDTLIYEYIMAYALNKAGLKARVARLKDSWRLDGKADIDGVLASQIPHIEYQNIIETAKAPAEYRKGWDIPELHKAYIQRRIDKFFYNGPIKEDNGVYYYVDNVKKTKDDEGNLDKPKAVKSEKLISNFTIKIVYVAYGESKAERFCSLKSKYGVKKEINLRAEMMVSRMSFQKACYEMGDFEYMGSDTQLQELWHYAFLSQDGREIIKLKFYGYDSKTKAWFFENGAYRDGMFFPLEDQRIIWIDEIGYMLPELDEV